MKNDHITEINQIISLLKNEKLDEAASVLQSTLDNTFSGTELIMAIRIHLTKLQLEKINPSTRKHIDHLLDKINNLLNA